MPDLILLFTVYNKAPSITQLWHGRFIHFMNALLINQSTFFHSCKNISANTRIWYFNLKKKQIKLFSKSVDNRIWIICNRYWVDSVMNERGLSIFWQISFMYIGFQAQNMNSVYPLKLFYSWSIFISFDIPNTILTTHTVCFISSFL